MAETLLDAEPKIGGLTREIPRNERVRTDLHDNAVGQTKTEQITRVGLAPKQVERFETLAAHPAVVAEVPLRIRSCAGASGPHSVRIGASLSSIEVSEHSHPTVKVWQRGDRRSPWP